MPRISKKRDLERLAEIAVLTDKKTGIYAERRRILKRRVEAKDSTKAELARAAGMLRGDVDAALKYEDK